MHPLSEPLLARTLRLIKQLDKGPPRGPVDLPFTYDEIAAATGVNRNWFAKLAQRKIAEPGVSKLEKVHDFLVDYIARQQRALSTDPSHSQSLGGSGNA